MVPLLTVLTLLGVAALWYAIPAVLRRLWQRHLLWRVQRRINTQQGVNSQDRQEPAIPHSSRVVQPYAPVGGPDLESVCLLGLVPELSPLLVRQRRP